MNKLLLILFIAFATLLVTRCPAATLNKANHKLVSSQTSVKPLSFSQGISVGRSEDVFIP
jgi:hypothetical protein